MRADLVCGFFEECLRHTKGREAGKLFRLERWQKALLGNLFGWVRDDGTRRYRECYCYVPRKNGKTTLAAGIALYLLCCDGERGAEVYSAACDRFQAGIVHSIAVGMRDQEPQLLSRLREHKTTKTLTFELYDSIFQAVSSDVQSKHGYNAHGVIIDELHAHPQDGELLKVLLTSMGSRSQPIAVIITTADFDRPSECNRKLEYAEKVRSGVFRDHAFLPAIYAADKEDDWTDPEIWKRANPCLGVSLSEEYLRRECLRAQADPVYENTFRRLHLNVKTEQAERWIQMGLWDACGDPVPVDKLSGITGYGGVDLAAVDDLAAAVFCFPIGGSFVLQPYFWAPREAAQRREHRDGVPYLTWEREGHIKLTEGTSIDYDVIRADIVEITRRWRIQEIACDPWNARGFIQKLQEDGVNIAEHRQGFATMSSPTKEFHRLLLAGKLCHGGHPILRWNASNVAIKRDESENLKPDKKKSTEKIDGIVAAIMAVGLASTARDNRSVYETRGLL